MLKTAPSGRLFAKDIFELFATLLVTIPIETHRRNFRTYQNTFTGEQTLSNLISLKVTQYSRHPDPHDPTRIVTLTSSKSLGISKDVAKTLCHHFLQAGLMESATDRSSQNFKEKGLYRVTQKGAHILERHINKNNIAAAHLQTLFGQTIPIKVLPLDRDPEFDLVLLDQRRLGVIFRRFAGPSPNNSKAPDDGDDSGSVASGEADRSRGIQVKDRQYFFKQYKNTFHGQGAVDWLRDFTTTISRDEANEIANEFVRAGLVEELIDLNELPGSGAGELVYTRTILYHLTEFGEQVAGWRPDADRDRDSVFSASTSTPFRHDADGGEVVDLRDMLSYSPSLRGNGHDRISANKGADGLDSKESNATRLQQILGDERLLPLFHEFLRTNFCEENLSFWSDCQDFLSRYNRGGENHRDNAAKAYAIYSTYLAPASPSELNIDYSLRQEILRFMNTAVGKGNGADVADPDVVIGPEVLETIVQLYGKVQTHIFRLMSTDSVPKFVKTRKYRQALQEQD
ncbi:uncharacterized protein VTP21DRAFT_3118 [Calcarisporiella thermophila]|uniref:uncharacterized protein n=1 Tax=Calcarisporiella thermophila TaxID=911321 RepID=UPI0037439E89